MRRLISSLAALGAAILLSSPALAYEGPITKRPFELAAFRFADGQQLPVRVGYETYGTLNARRDNAILICHYFGGSSHAAGRYEARDARPGYWDSLIGPGKAIDTDRFYVVSVDVLANINAGDPRVITTGPATIDPATGRPYGSRFPVVGIRDQVEVQRALMEQLGIPRWHAVMGASLGGMQALQWAVSYPERVPRLMVVAAPGRSDGNNQVRAQVMIDAIEADAHFCGGDYYGGEAPRRGLGAAWKLMYGETVGREAIARQYPDPAAGFVKTLASQAEQRVGSMDANAWIALSRASRDFDVSAGYGPYAQALARVKARVLVVAALGDQLFPPETLKADLVAPLEAAGKAVTYRLLATERGHLGAIFDLDREAEAVGRLLGP